jgi:hypothetical protein
LPLQWPELEIQRRFLSKFEMDEKCENCGHFSVLI